MVATVVAARTLREHPARHLPKTGERMGGERDQISNERVVDVGTQVTI
jgi:hypothetical protein